MGYAVKKIYRTIMKKIILFLPILGYLLVILVVFGKTLLPAKNNIIFAPDIWRYHYFQRPFLGESLKDGIIPWWDPYILSGQPYLEHPQITSWYLPNLLFTFLKTNIAVSWYFTFHLFWAMLGMYYMVQIFLQNAHQKKNTIAAWIAGISFGLSGYFVARIYAGHIDIIAASSWMPWVITYVWQAMIRPKPRYIAFAGIMFAFELIAGHQMIAVYTLEALGIAAAVLALTKRSLMPFIVSGFSLTVGFALAAIQILPNQQLISQSIRTLTLPEAWSVIGAPIPAHMLEFLDPFYFYPKLPDSGFGFEHAGYIGKLPLLIALLTVMVVIWKRKKYIEVWIAVLVGLFSLWVWLGPNAPVDLFGAMRNILPIYNQIRIPSRHIVLYVLVGSALFGAGLSVVRNKLLQIVVCALVFIDLIPFAWGNIHLGQIPESREDTDLVRILTENPGLYRFLPDFYHGDPLRDILEFDAPIRHKIFSVSGYETPPLRNYWKFLLAVSNLDITKEVQYIETTPPFTNITSPYLDFLNVRYVLSPLVSDTLYKFPDRFSLVKENKDRGYRLYENRNVLPRFYFVQSATLDTRENIDRLIRLGVGDPRRAVFIEKEKVISPIPMTSSCASNTFGAIDVATYQSDKIIVQTNSPCDVYLVSSEVYYPGWEAYIDGSKTHVFEGNLAFRTIFVPKGVHTIIFSYLPRIVIIGAAISFLGLVVCLLLIFNPLHFLFRRL